MRLDAAFLRTVLVLGWTLPAFSQSSFQRGDSNADGVFNISDASHLLSFLFLGGPAPPCLDAADANDDGVIDVSDGPFSLGYLFLGGPPPGEPFGSCGVDSTIDELGCATYPPCPQQPLFPRPEPDPCGQLGDPCESAVIGPYTFVSTPDGNGVFTEATHEDGDVLHLRWMAAGAGAAEMLFSQPEAQAFATLPLRSGVPTLRSANSLAAVVLLLNTPEPQAGGGAGAEEEHPGNHAGCDPHGWMKWADCNSCGGCCDTHDACIDANCLGRSDSGDVRECARLEYRYRSCLFNADTETDVLECEALARCSSDCMSCHLNVIDCFNICTTPFFSGPGPSECCARNDCGKPQQCINNGVVETNPDRCLIPEAESHGDPHLITFDRLAYDFQAVGEFVMVRSTGDSLQLQARTMPWRGSRHVAVATALAMNVMGDRVGLYLGRSPALLVNGVPTAPAALPVNLPGGGRIEIAGRSHVVRWPDSSQVWVTPYGSYLNLKVRISPRRRRAVEGLLGNLDGNRANDLTTRDGVVLASRPSLEALYRDYGESWRIAAGESLFDYLEGESTESFTDRTFPDGLASVQSLTAGARAQAEAACAAAGVTDPYLLEMCLLDVGFTGDSEFAGSLGEVTPPESQLEPPLCEQPAVTWTDWTSGSNTRAAGNLGAIAVTLTGVIANPQVQGGANYWIRSSETYTSPGLVDRPPDTSDIIAYVGGPTTGVQTLTFSSPVVDPVMAIFSLGQPGIKASYDFDTPFEILNVGPGHYGNGTLTAEEGDVLLGQEGYGLLRFRGLISTITWTLPLAENWHGIQVGSVHCR